MEAVPPRHSSALAVQWPSRVRMLPAATEATLKVLVKAISELAETAVAAPAR